jgi:Skp family chaperone for outer membrane proteins
MDMHMRTLGFIFLIAFAFLPPVAMAADTSVAVVDVVRILSKSDAAISINTQREKLRSGFLEEISEAEQDLRREEQDLSKRGSELTRPGGNRNDRDRIVVAARSSAIAATIEGQGPAVVT